MGDGVLVEGVGLDFMPLEVAVYQLQKILVQKPQRRPVHPSFFGQLPHIIPEVAQDPAAVLLFQVLHQFTGIRQLHR